MRICGIDQGINTGIVIIGSTGGLIYHDTIPIAFLEQALRLIVTFADIDEYIQERLPHTMAPFMAEVEYRLKEFRADVTTVKISPGEWKPVAKARGWMEGLTFKTQHEKDAYCMIKYHIFKMAGHEIGTI